MQLKTSASDAAAAAALTFIVSAATVIDLYNNFDDFTRKIFGVKNDDFPKLTEFYT